MSVEDIFKEIVARQAYCMMYHNQMANYFDFLGLMGLKRLHEYNYFRESFYVRILNRYYVNHHMKLLTEKEISSPNAIPDTFFVNRRDDVTESDKVKYTKEAMLYYQKLEKETKDVYSIYAKALMDKGHMKDYECISEILSCSAEELKTINRYIIDYNGVGYDMSYISNQQNKMHEKYKNKSKKYKANIK